MWVERRGLLRVIEGVDMIKCIECVSGDIIVNTLFCAVMDTLVNDGGGSVREKGPDSQ